MTYRSIPPISVHPKWIGRPVVGLAGKEELHLQFPRNALAIRELTSGRVEPVSGQEQAIGYHQPQERPERQGEPTERQIKAAGGHASALTVAPVPSVFRTQDRIDGSSGVGR